MTKWGSLQKFVLLDLLKLFEVKRLMVKELKWLKASPNTKLLLKDLLDSIPKDEGGCLSI